MTAISEALSDELLDKGTDAALTAYWRAVENGYGTMHTSNHSMRAALRAGYAAIVSAQSLRSGNGGEVPTHRHVKRGSEYVLIGIGRMQAKNWESVEFSPSLNCNVGLTVDLEEVAIYRSVDDGSLWVRPREEFEDGRFEALSTPPVGAETSDLSLDPTEWHYAVAAITKEAERMYGCSPLTLEINRRLSGSDNPLADAYASRTLSEVPPRSDKANDEAEAWCRLAGQAVDALDALSGWEVESDDEDAAGQMAEYAEKAVAAVRKAYPPVSASTAVPVGEDKLWQDIATAPKETMVLLWSPPANLSDRPDQQPDIRVSTTRHWCWATHWMPLPGAPASLVSQEAAE